MKAFVYQGDGKLGLEDRERPALIESTDVIIKMLKTTICKTDLHIYAGDLPAIQKGRILGHEGIGRIEEIGRGVHNFKTGDRVLVSCMSSCGRCANCRSGAYSRCSSGGGWILGNTIDGMQAEFVRIPFADHSLYGIPAQADEDAMVMLSDILPTGLECGAQRAKIKPGDTVCILGCGPVGLAALITAQFFTPLEIFVVDEDETRLDVARKMGASCLLNNSSGQVQDLILNLTAGRGVDVAIEAIGSEASFDICQRIVAAGGCIANIGIHGLPVQFNLHKLWDKDITVTTQIVDTTSTPMLLNCTLAGKIRPQDLITHRFALADILQAYEVYGNAIDQKVLKVIITNS